MAFPPSKQTFHSPLETISNETWSRARDCLVELQPKASHSGCTRPQVGEEVLGIAAKVEISKESTTIVGDGSTEDAVKARVKQIKNVVAETEMDYEKEKLNERIARLSGGVAIIQVCPQPPARKLEPCALNLTRILCNISWICLSLGYLRHASRPKLP